MEALQSISKGARHAIAYFNIRNIYVHILIGNINNACQHSSIKIAPTAHMLTAAGQETKKSTSNIINVMLACLIPSHASDCISVKLGNHDITDICTI
ncbi:hypothetical protein T03_1895 [Trichinella britovi]|uniref:Uncharacterized protein n=1 Tax=Trichinella britovi TaxID=45882 RepID=A0A0V1DJJ3_TRIBR|nr:hypothetical protein T03_1895 [Trichinella britovi]